MSQPQALSSQSSLVFRKHQYDEQPSKLLIVEWLVQYGTQALLYILALRGLMSILGAGLPNRFTVLISALTEPLVMPFRSMFHYDTSIFQVHVLVAIVVYALVGHFLLYTLRNFVTHTTTISYEFREKL